VLTQGIDWQRRFAIHRQLPVSDQIVSVNLNPCLHEARLGKVCKTPVQIWLRGSSPAATI